MDGKKHPTHLIRSHTFHTMDQDLTSSLLTLVSRSMVHPEASLPHRSPQDVHPCPWPSSSILRSPQAWHDPTAGGAASRLVPCQFWLAGLEREPTAQGGQSLVLPPALPAASLALPCQHHGTHSPACPPACGSPTAHKAHIFRPHRPARPHSCDSPSWCILSSATGSSPGAWHGGSAGGAACSQTRSFWLLCRSPTCRSSGSGAPHPTTASSISSSPPFGRAHGRALQATASASTAAVSHGSIYTAPGQLLAVIDQPSHS